MLVAGGSRDSLWFLRPSPVCAIPNVVILPVPYCTFCNIVAGTERAQVFYEDDQVLVFRNLLRCVEVMLLAVPKRHLRQEELWNDLGAVGRAAAAMGRRYCPNGFRLVSNFGPDALQSQPHAHVHVLGGSSMDALMPVGRPARTLIDREDLYAEVAAPGDWPPVAITVEPRPATSQHALWEDMGAVGAELVRLGQQHCGVGRGDPAGRPYERWYASGGFRLVSNFGWDALQTRRAAHVYLLGGAELGHYI